MLTQIAGFIKKYIGDPRGTVIAAFALTLPVVVGSAGMALDLAEAYLVRQRLGQALDASALAAAASETDEDAIEQRVEDFFEANYPDEKIGETFDLEIVVDGDDLIVSAKADFNTSFMRVMGIDTITVASETIVRREVRGLEVVLVLDNTGSMSSNNNIAALREAATSFVEILFERADDPEDIKIGLVPYASSVNVGPYGVGETPGGFIYASGDTFVVDEDGDELDADVYTTNYYSRSWHSANWLGCVTAYNEDGWDEDDDENDPYPFDTIDHEGPWQRYSYEYESCGWQWVGYWDYQCNWQTYSYPNVYCPRTPILPMTSDEDDLYDSIDSMVANGATLGNFGMVWGYRVISPEAPFSEGEAWDDPRWRKAIIMMTDGDNWMGGDYTAYWRTDNHDIDNDDLNDRFAEVCDELKEEGVLIYTVTFTSNIDDDTKDYYRDCATSSAQYYDAPSQDDLIDVFEAISRELANIHISG